MNTFMYVACMLIWGLNFIAVKIQGTEAALEVSLLYRSVIAFLLFYAVFKIKHIDIKKQHMPYSTVIGFGICNFAVSYLLLYYGTIYSTAALVTLIFSLKAIVTPIFLRIVFKLPLERRIYVGGMFGLASVFVIVYPQISMVSTDFMLGIVLAFVGMIVTSVGDTLSYYNNMRQVEPVTSNVIGMLAAIVVMAFITLLSGKSLVFPSTMNYWIGLFYLAICASFIAWLFYLILVKNIGASESSYMVALFPVIGGFASVLMGESVLTIQLVLGIVLAMIGTFIALVKKKPVSIEVND